MFRLSQFFISPFSFSDLPLEFIVGYVELGESSFQITDIRGDTDTSGCLVLRSLQQMDG